MFHGYAFESAEGLREMHYPPLHETSMIDAPHVSSAKRGQEALKVFLVQRESHTAARVLLAHGHEVSSNHCRAAEL
jgi:hypothetical protein